MIDAYTIGLFAMDGVSEHAGLDVGPGDARETEGSGETLVTLRIVVLESDLDLDGFDEVTLLSLHFGTTAGDGFTGGVGEDLVDGLVEEGRVQLVRHGTKLQNVCCYRVRYCFYRVVKGRDDNSLLTKRDMIC